MKYKNIPIRLPSSFFFWVSDGRVLPSCSDGLFPSLFRIAFSADFASVASGAAPDAADAPDFSAPDFPDFSAPDFSAPDFSAPDFSAPDFASDFPAAPGAFAAAPAAAVGAFAPSAAGGWAGWAGGGAGWAGGGAGGAAGVSDALPPFCIGAFFFGSSIY